MMTKRVTNASYLTLPHALVRLYRMEDYDGGKRNRKCDCNLVLPRDTIVRERRSY